MAATVSTGQPSGALRRILVAGFTDTPGRAYGLAMAVLAVLGSPACRPPPCSPGMRA